MEKKTKIIMGCIIGFAFLCFLIAFFISNTKTYIVTFDSDGGTYVSNQKIKKGNYVSKPINPVKNGYEFIEWRLNNKQYDFTKKVTCDMTLKAVWKEAKKKYEIVLEVDGKEKKVEVKEDEIIDLTKVDFEEKIGYELTWYLDDKEFNIEETKITSDIKLVGKYVEVKTYTVKFDTVGGSKVDEQVVNENKKVKEPVDPTKEGYILEGWYLNNKEYDFNEKVTSNITLKAKWVEDKDVKRYTVTFDSVGGSYINSQKVIENKKIVEPGIPTKKDYKFVEWQLDGKKYDFNSKVTKDIVLKAKWQHIVSYTVTFDSDGGSINQTLKIEYGTKVENPGNPKKDGYTFSGWYSKGGKYNFDSVITGDITITAHWDKIENYKVSFNLNGGVCTTCEDKSVIKGSKISNPGTPTKSGYTFNGWMLGTNIFDFNTSITSNITLIASWSEISKYTVKFDSDGGTTYNNQSIQQGNKASNPGTPTKSGYTFSGWLLGTNVFDFNTPITSSITLKAKWNEIVYTIKATYSDSHSVDAILKVYNGSNEITNYKCIALSDGTCLDSNKVSMNFFEREKSFIVVLNDNTKIKAVK